MLDGLLPKRTPDPKKAFNLKLHWATGGAASGAGAGTALLLPIVGTICLLLSMNALMSSSVTFALACGERAVSIMLALPTTRTETYVLEPLHKVLQHLDAFPLELPSEQASRAVLLQPMQHEPTMLQLA